MDNPDARHISSSEKRFHDQAKLKYPSRADDCLQRRKRERGCRRILYASQHLSELTLQFRGSRRHLGTTPLILTLIGLNLVLWD